MVTHVETLNGIRGERLLPQRLICHGDVEEAVQDVSVTGTKGSHASYRTGQAIAKGFQTEDLRRAIVCQ